MIYKAVDSKTGKNVIGRLKKDGNHLETYLDDNVRILEGSLKKIKTFNDVNSNNSIFSK